MSTSLRKAFAHIYVAYKNGGWTNSLSGENFVVHESNDELNFEIDLSANYKSHNKDTNSYSDIHELLESHEQIDYIQIDEQTVLKGLTTARKRHPDANWVLTLNVGKLGSFRYTVKPNKYSMGYQFNVSNPI